MQLQSVVAPKANRLNPWEYNRKLYERRNEVERRFLHIALIFDALFYVITP